MTQDDRRGMAWTLLVEYLSQTMSFPSCDADTRFLESAPQCIAYTLERCPRRVLLVLIWILPMGSMLPVAWAKVVSHAAFRPSLMTVLRCSASCRNCSSSFMLRLLSRPLYLLSRVSAVPHR